MRASLLQTAIADADFQQAVHIAGYLDRLGDEDGFKVFLVDVEHWRRAAADALVNAKTPTHERDALAAEVRAYDAVIDWITTLRQKADKQVDRTRERSETAH